MANEGVKNDVTPASALPRLKAALSKVAPPKGSNKVKPDRASKKEDKIFGDKARQEHTKQVVHHLAVILLWIGAGCFYGVLIVRVLHFILPENPYGWVPHCWLTDEQLQGIDKFFFSGALGAAIAKYLKDNVGLKDDEEEEGKEGEEV